MRRLRISSKLVVAGGQACAIAGKRSTPGKLLITPGGVDCTAPPKSERGFYVFPAMESMKCISRAGAARNLTCPRPPDPPATGFPVTMPDLRSRILP